MSEQPPDPRHRDQFINPQQPPQGQQPLPPPMYQYPSQDPYGSRQPAYAPPKKKHNGVWIAVAVVLVVIVVACGVVGMATSGTTKVATDTTSTSSSTQAPQTSPATQPVSKTAAKHKPTPKPTPTLTPAQTEAAYKLVTTDTTVAGLDKDGNAGQGKDVHFTCSISGFVKDSSGNTAGANVTDVNDSGSVVQVAFTPGTNVTQMNEHDILEVWGADQGTSSGSNAFGATVQEVVVQAQYMKDQTTGYRVDS